MAEQNPEFAPFARDILDNKRIKPNRRVFDTKKVSDHFAIIPTGKMEKLTGDAQKLFEMVMARFLAVFFPAAVFEDTRRTTLITHQDGVTDAFLTTGRVLVEPGLARPFTDGRLALPPRKNWCPSATGRRPPCVRLKSATP